MNELASLPTEEPIDSAPASEPEDSNPPVGSEPVASGEVIEGVDEPPDPAALQAEIDALEKKRQKAEADARYWREEKAKQRAEFFKEKNKGGETPPATPAPDTTLKKPVESDFEDFASYVDALADYKVAVARETWEREDREKATAAETRERDAKLQAGIQKGFAKYDDFEEVALDNTVPITTVIKDIMADNPETAADVAYYLGKNRAEAIQIARMTPSRAARAIAKIESDIAAAAPPPKKKSSEAPPPITPIGANNVVQKDPAKMTQAEFEEWRKSQGARPY